MYTNMTMAVPDVTRAQPGDGRAHGRARRNDGAPRATRAEAAQGSARTLCGSEDALTGHARDAGEAQDARDAQDIRTGIGLGEDQAAAALAA